MGCDIHMYAEYSERNDPGHWTPLGGCIHGWRDYALFGRLAGVRRDGIMFPVRGVPADAAYAVRGDNTIYVSDTPGDGRADRATAERWVAEGCSEWVGERQTHVTNPDAHTHSWITPAEFRAALEAPSEWGPHVSYWAVLAALEDLERRDCTARLVFWFDN